MGHLTQCDEFGRKTFYNGHTFTERAASRALLTFRDAGSLKVQWPLAAFVWEFLV